MPSERHEIVHAVIVLGDAREDLSHPVHLLALGHRLEAEVRRPGRVGDRIFGGFGVLRWLLLLLL